MTQTDATDIWLEGRWRDLRRNLLAVFRQRVAGLVDALAEPASGVTASTFPAALDGFVASVQADLDRRRRSARGGYGDMFSTALALMAHTTKLHEHFQKLQATLLDRQQKHLGGGLTTAFDLPGEFRSEFVKYARYALRDMRLDMLMTTPHRRQTWNRLDKISRDLLRTSGSRASRCERTHFTDILKYCREKWPDDDFLPRTVDTVQEYFYLNCPDCFSEISDGGERDSLTAKSDYWHERQFEELILLPDADKMLFRLKNCLGKLEEFDRRVIEMSYKLGDISYPSVAVFCTSMNVSRRHFYAAVDRAEKQLADCVLALRC